MRIRTAVCIAVFFQISRLVADDNPGQFLVANLAGRNEAIRTFSADVEIIHTPGRDILKFANAQRKLADFARRHKIGKPRTVKESESDYLQLKQDASEPPKKQRLRYFVLMPGKLRFETWNAAHEGGDKRGEPTVEILDGPARTTFLPASRADTRFAQLTHSDALRHWTPWLEDARGAAIPRYFLSVDGLPESSFQLVYWDELMPILSLETAQVDQRTLPNGKQLITYAEVTTKPVDYPLWPDLHLPHYRYSMWFDPENLMTLVRLEIRQLEPRKDGRHYELPLNSYEWTRPHRLPDGQAVYLQCDYSEMVHTLDCEERSPVDEDAWKMAAFEMHRYSIRFSNVKVNEPLDDGLFTVTPPAGTNVVDEVKGERYIVGSAGEALARTAIDLQARLGYRTMESQARPWRWIIVAILVSLIGAAASWHVVRRRCSISSH